MTTVESVLGAAQGYGDDDGQSLGGQSYPFAQWMNGTQALKAAGVTHPLYTGGWFLPDEQAERLALSPEALGGWVEGTLTHRGGGETAGWMRRDLTVAVIAWRRAWMAVDGGRNRRFPWGMYERAREANGGKTPRSRLQVLTAVQGWGLDEPLALTIGGTGGRAFFDALTLAQRNILQPIAKVSKAKTLPFRMFWLTFGPGRDANGVPTFVKVGEGTASSYVTPPALIGAAERLTTQQIVALFVDADDPKARTRLNAFDAIWNDPATQEWLHAWDTEYEPEDAHPAAATRDDFVPALDEEEIPF